MADGVTFTETADLGAADTASLIRRKVETRPAGSLTVVDNQDTMTGYLYEE